MVLLFVAIALLGQLIAPYSATEQIASAARKAPSLAHLFGTDRPRAPSRARATSSALRAWAACSWFSIVIVYTPIVARVVRSVVLGIKHKGYVEAAQTQGESVAYILFRESLPSVLPALAVEAAPRFSYAIFLVASLGFLGVGVQPPNPELLRK